MEFQLLDWFVLIGVAVAASGGYRLGLVTRLASWVGIAVGVALAFVALPSVLRTADAWQAANKLGLVLLLLLLASMLGQMLGQMVGTRISANVPDGKWRRTDRVAGGVAGVLGVFVALWLLLPVMADVPGWPSQQARTSSIAQALHDNTPEPPDAVRAINRSIGLEGAQPVFDGLRPAPDTGPPPENVALSASTVQQVSQSTVRVEGIACRRTQNGSGFAVGPGLFATNAHVVAGESSTSIISTDGRTHRATVVAFDSDRDIALLRSNSFRPPPLRLVEADAGDAGAVFGHPGGQSELAVSPATVRDQVIAQGRDLFDNHQTRREVLILAAQLAQGDSGGALVNTEGNVMGIAFAIAPDNPNTAYALSTDEIQSVLQSGTSNEVSTGSCIRD